MIAHKRMYQNEKVCLKIENLSVDPRIADQPAAVLKASGEPLTWFPLEWLVEKKPIQHLWKLLSPFPFSTAFLSMNLAAHSKNDTFEMHETK